MQDAEPDEEGIFEVKASLMTLALGNLYTDSLARNVPYAHPGMTIAHAYLGALAVVIQKLVSSSPKSLVKENMSQLKTILDTYE
jgi:hypothetical protein